MNNATRSQIFKRAWERVKTNASSFSAALKASWAEYRAFVLRTSEDSSKEFKAVFVKKDGTVREAHGTLDLNRIPEDQHPKGLRTPPPHVFTYWDIDKQAWRSFRLNSLQTFNPV